MLLKTSPPPAADAAYGTRPMLTSTFSPPAAAQQAISPSALKKQPIDVFFCVFKIIFKITKWN
jgi:hypothetical protein